MAEKDPDWIPSLNLGHSEETCQRTKRVLQSTSPETCPAPRPKRARKKKLSVGSRLSETEQEDPGPERWGVWREARSLLLSVLQPPTNISRRTEDKTQETNQSFRDYFRDALQSSLEEASRSRTRSDHQSSDESTSCVNCAHMQMKVQDLQEKLRRLTADRENMKTLQRPDPVPVDQEETDCLRPAPPHPPPPLSICRGGRQDLGSSNKPKSSLRFRNIWLKRFWFLRYSETLGEMWCHVCRLHTEKVQDRMSLTTGTSMFRHTGIKRHSQTKHHLDNVKRHRLHLQRLRLQGPPQLS